MRRQDFHYELPDELIARQPAAERRASRLLTLDGPTGEVAHRQFADLLSLVNPGDLMVFNDTRVIPARVFGQKASGGKLEILVERVLERSRVLAHDGLLTSRMFLSIASPSGARVHRDKLSKNRAFGLLTLFQSGHSHAIAVC